MRNQLRSIGSLAVWTDVLRPPEDEPDITAIRVESVANGTFLVLLRAPNREFDMWLASEAELLEYLQTMLIDFPHKSDT